MPWEPWELGRVWIGKNGKRTYYGEVSGKLVTTRQHTPLEAQRWLEMANSPIPIHPLDKNLIGEYIMDCGQRGLADNAKRKKHLERWSDRVGQRPVTLKLLNDILPTLTGSRNMAASLKAYFTWLRQQGRVERKDDPTIDLRKPNPKPKDWDRLIPIESHEKVLAVIDGRDDKGKPVREGRWGDLMTVLLGTGLHVSELLRFCRNGTTNGNVILVQHKKGEPHRVEVSDRVLAAAKRSRERGGFSLIRFYRAIEAGCEEAKVDQFDPGGYRHTVATLAVQAGNSPEEVAHFLGHKSAYMVKTIYARTVTPRKVKTSV